MTLQQFKDKWLSKQLEVAGSSGAKYQCVDLVNGYFRDVLNLPIIEWTNAKDFPEKADKSLFDWIPYTPDAIPQEGDVPVWNGRVGAGAGHIAVALKGSTINNLKSFDQNWSKPLYCTTESHTYTNVRGWLRPKKLDIISPTVKITPKTKVPLNLLRGEHFLLGSNDDTIEIQALKSILNDQTRDIKNLQEKNTEIVMQLANDEIYLHRSGFNSLSEVGEAYTKQKTTLEQPLVRLAVSIQDWLDKRTNHVKQ